MTNNATIIFSQAGVRPPVYVTTSLSGWAILEMDAEKAHEGSEDFLFKKQFVDVAEGNHQYKIRIGEHHWVLDESTESVPDEHGNLNNVVHAKPKPAPAKTGSTQTSKPDTASDTPDPTGSRAPVEDHKDEGKIEEEEEHRLPSIPIPFVVVEKVADKEHTPYGDLQPVALPSDDSKRTADAEPDFEEVKVDSPIEPPTSKSPEVPLLVVEKTDDEPAYGEDFGEDATIAQKIAHEQRAADASPDRLVISPETPALSSSGDDDVAPLFPHESGHADDFSRAPSIDTIDEESIPSSTDQASSSEAIYMPLEDPNESQEDGEFGNGHLMSHETGSASQSGDLQAAPLFSHENGSDQEDSSKIDDAPLLSHETGINGDDRSLSDEDELDKAPLLSHETDFPDYKNSSIVTNSEYDNDDGDDTEPQHYGPYDEDDEPLLPHERGSVAVSKTDSEDDEHFTLNNQPTFSHENDAPQSSFGGNARPVYFRTRTNSSTLPHKLPRTDEDDDNLLDPSLEEFPTNREQILERVKSIGLHLPEDESTDDNIHSPQFSVLSQACSSVELAPVKSYTSLASVPEAEYSDEDDEDVDSLASPIMIGGASTRPWDKADALETPAADESKRLQVPDPESNEMDVKTAMPAGNEDEDGERIGEDKDPLEDSLLPLLPSKVAEAVAPSDTADTTTDTNDTTDDSGLRERRKAPEMDPDDTSPTKELKLHSDTEHTGSISRFITACTQDHKKASFTAIVISTAVAAAYFVVFGS